MFFDIFDSKKYVSMDILYAYKIYTYMYKYIGNI